MDEQKLIEALHALSVGLRQIADALVTIAEVAEKANAEDNVSEVRQ